MRGTRTVIVDLIAALGLSGCMGRTTPFAVDPGLAYGLPYAAPVANVEPGDSAYHLDAGDKLGADTAFVGGRWF
ncbi:hypothetical protein JQ615_11845 [Bradyrhizobium jicamae]|uniref:Uncharacterized protein n=1 Tax=Bradyrhizobium jicamae TaxID=280332 RepID=A0ABS5FH10_9BRAD|nr:hypothetical protein [Bradyrhizobium jicamae]MBR0796082.1 hypothetical protein [Bradyrhizobium jicamae]